MYGPNNFSIRIKELMQILKIKRKYQINLNYEFCFTHLHNILFINI